MVLVRDDVEADLVAQAVLVEAFLEELRRDLRVAIAVRQIAAHRINRVEALLRDERVGVFAKIPGLHHGSSSGQRSRRERPLPLPIAPLGANKVRACRAGASSMRREWVPSLSPASGGEGNWLQRRRETPSPPL